MFRSINLAAFLVLPTAVAEPVTFNKHIRPILSDNCFACHGFDKNIRDADLRLDTREGALAVIVPGDPDESELITRIFSDDPDEVMPSVKSHKALDDEEKQLLRRWVEEGAEYEQHWAWSTPKKTAVPGTWSGREIDFYVRDALAATGQEPAPEAAKWRLVRRLYLDLIGLPPDQEEIAAGLEMSHEELVDLLLAAPHFGEKMAVSWLDLVRYADTAGYHGDQSLSVSPYRDYVIEAFNANLPFDQFTREQLAGDLLPTPTQDQLVASGYNRLNMTTEEGGSQAKEYLAKYAGDRVRAISTVWMGATLGCAECHDHKFDPYTTKDFYTMAAFFADIEEVGVYGARKRPPEVNVYSDGERSELDQILEGLERSTAEFEGETAALAEAQKKWQHDLAAELASATSDTVWFDDDLGPSAIGWGSTSGENVFSGKISWFRESSKQVQQSVELSENYNVQEGDRVYFHVWIDPENPTQGIMIQLGPESRHRAFWGNDVFVQGGKGNDSPEHRPMGDLPKAGEWARLELPLEKVGLVAGDQIDHLTFHQHGGSVYWDQFGVTLPPGPLSRPHGFDVWAAAEQPDESGSTVLRKAFRGTTALLQATRENLVQLEQRKQEIEAGARTMLITRAVKPRPVRVLPRGNWMDDSGEVVGPAVPEFLGKISEPGGRRATRLDLAEWLVSTENPLTSRVFVNRMWKQFFGRGLAAVMDDLGAQGDWPTHPELLDWLAIEFIESGWDVKHLVREIVCSDTYKQSTRVPQELRRADPYNRFLARQASFRLDAEMVRDAALAVSGLLVRDLGGRSVMPYQPAGYYRHLNFPKRVYKADTGNDQWRRGVYTHWQRTFLHPMMKTFDAPSREECAAERSRSNTPLQALVLLNDPTYVEAARAFAQRVLENGKGATFETRLTWAFREALSRPPSVAEINEMGKLYRSHLVRFSSDMDAAISYTSAGDAPLPQGAGAAETAAWLSVSRVIFNLHEIISRY